jgi:succinate dehydrogenase / fumarate reductase, cytochrome b subunit
MAITGIIGIGFVIGHMIGNLKMYLGVVTEDGRRVYDSTSTGSSCVSSRAHPPEYAFLWMLRARLLGALVLHVHAAYSLTVLNRKARPVKYQSARDYQVANFASRTMRWTGIIVLLFIIVAPRRSHLGLGQPRLPVRRGVLATSTPASAVSRWRSSTSSPTSRSASTCSTAPGACSSRWAGTTPSSTTGGATWPPRIATIVVVGNVSFPVGARRHRRVRPRRRHRDRR